MEIPRDSAIAMSTTQQREQNKAEQERLKRLVLNYEEREEELDKQGALLYLIIPSLASARLTSHHQCSTERVACAPRDRSQLRSGEPEKGCESPSRALIAQVRPSSPVRPYALGTAQRRQCAPFFAAASLFCARI